MRRRRSRLLWTWRGCCGWCWWGRGGGIAGEEGIDAAGWAEAHGQPDVMKEPPAGEEAGGEAELPPLSVEEAWGGLVEVEARCGLWGG
jgi:hypothetical protein